MGDWTSVKNKTFYSKALTENPLTFHFLTQISYGCQIRGQDQNEEFKKIEKHQEKAIRIVNFLPLNAPVEKQIYEMNILKLKDFIMLQNILFVKDCLSENAPGSFNDKFYSSKVPLNHTTKSSSTYQLKVNNLKSERYGHKSIVNIRLEKPPKNIKAKRPNDEEVRP